MRVIVILFLLFEYYISSFEVFDLKLNLFLVGFSFKVQFIGDLFDLLMTCLLYVYINLFLNIYSLLTQIKVNIV